MAFECGKPHLECQVSGLLISFTLWLAAPHAAEAAARHARAGTATTAARVPYVYGNGPVPVGVGASPRHNPEARYKVPAGLEQHADR